MPSTLIKMGALLDSWTSDGEVGLTETAEAITVSRLSSGRAREILSAAHQLELTCDMHDDAGEVADEDDINDDLSPFVATILKPDSSCDRLVITSEGLSQALDGDDGGIWQIANCSVPFASGTTAFQPWGAGEVFSAASPTKSPLDLVRESAEVRLVPSDIRKWALRGEVSDRLWADPAFQIFMSKSLAFLIRSLASEVSSLSNIVFNGPPRLSITIPTALNCNHISIAGYRNLQAAAAWVYEDKSTAEQRHALLAAECARTIHRGEAIGAAFQSVGKELLEGARLAFQLSQSKLSREAIKTQTELRKAIAEDTSKAAESARSLAGATAIAIATGVTLVATRSVRVTDPWVISAIAMIVGIYLIVVALNGWTYLRLQNKLREEWRKRFYRFIPTDDYEAMVKIPAKAAEQPYHRVALAAIVVALTLGWLAITSWDYSAPKPLDSKGNGDQVQPPNKSGKVNSEPAEAPSSN